MSGSAGSSPSRNRKPEGSTLSGYAQNSRRECVGLVAGQAVRTAEWHRPRTGTISRQNAKLRHEGKTAQFLGVVASNLNAAAWSHLIYTAAVRYNRCPLSPTYRATGR